MTRVEYMGLNKFVKYYSAVQWFTWFCHLKNAQADMAIYGMGVGKLITHT